MCIRDSRTVVLIQYWRSFEDLESYSRAKDLAHLPAWRAFNKSVRDNGTVGIFHETYRVPYERIETVYGNMPVFGLGQALGTTKVGGGAQSAADLSRRTQIASATSRPMTTLSPPIRSVSGPLNGARETISSAAPGRAPIR